MSEKHFAAKKKQQDFFLSLGVKNTMDAKMLAKTPTEQIMGVAII